MRVQQALRRVSDRMEATEPYRTGLAVGVTTFVEGDSEVDLLRRADASMYELKRQRRSIRVDASRCPAAAETR